MHISSYPKVYAIGHKAVVDLLKDPVLVEEKIDGSQISFCRVDGVLSVRSKNCEINLDAPDSMFSLAVDVIKSLPLEDGYVYRGEYLKSPRHNSLRY